MHGEGARVRVQGKSAKHTDTMKMFNEMLRADHGWKTRLARHMLSSTELERTSVTTVVVTG